MEERYFHSCLDSRPRPPRPLPQRHAIGAGHHPLPGRLERPPPTLPLDQSRTPNQTQHPQCCTYLRDAASESMTLAHNFARLGGKTMKATKGCWLVLLASAAGAVTLAYAGVALAQVPTGTPGETNPPGWKPHVAYPFSHVTPGQWSRPGKPGPRIEFPQGRQPPPTAPITPSPKELRELRREEEQTRKYGHITVEPPHPAKHWGTANGRPPERYHRTAPPTPSPGGGASSGPQSSADPPGFNLPIYTRQ